MANIGTEETRMDKKIYIIGLLVDELKHEVIEKDYSSDRLKELKKDRDGWMATTKVLTEKCFKLKEENEKLKNKKKRGDARGEIVIKALFGDSYTYVNIDALLNNIKKKMDRHEKTKEENATHKAATLNLFDLRIHLGNTAMGREVLKQFDGRKKEENNG
jgi:hypothetical protein